MVPVSTLNVSKKSSQNRKRKFVKKKKLYIRG